MIKEVPLYSHACKEATLVYIIQEVSNHTWPDGEFARLEICMFVPEAGVAYAQTTGQKLHLLYRLLMI